MRLVKRGSRIGGRDKWVEPGDRSNRKNAARQPGKSRERNSWSNHKTSMTSILDKIYAAKRDEVRDRRAIVSPVAIVAAAGRAPKPRDFIGALRLHRPAIIAEIKRASPSKGDIFNGLDPASVPKDYADAGGAATSVFTHKHFT